ncbi:MAG: restriction endonuclease [Acidobacteria bacterium]|nr:MAG: restriction endonuclease [Acidobacteriota bacterium]MCC6781927.1 restriction endonuclease [Planctomycetota bacterium]GIK77711.1 MAG: hypothetical protein BroJett022_14010 [Actinomycetes bacterium]
MAANPELLSWLRAACAEYRFDVAALYQRHGDHAWPLEAADFDDLSRQLDAGGHFLPLPKEPAALANVLEVSIVRFLVERAADHEDVDVEIGTERGYPDLEFSGRAFGGGFHAVDLKAARRKPLKRSPPRQTQSRITLYTGNTYFAWPDLQWPGMLRPFAEYESHVDVIAIYTLDTDATERATEIEVIVQEPWRIASKERSSTTREYIGAVLELERLREGAGDFDSEEDFYKYWRAFDFRMPKALRAQLSKLISQQKEAGDRD